MQTGGRRNLKFFLSFLLSLFSLALLHSTSIPNRARGTSNQIMLPSKNTTTVTRDREKKRKERRKKKKWKETK